MTIFRFPLSLEHADRAKWQPCVRWEYLGTHVGEQVQWERKHSGHWVNFLHRSISLQVAANFNTLTKTHFICSVLELNMDASVCFSLSFASLIKKKNKHALICKIRMSLLVVHWRFVLFMHSQHLKTQRKVKSNLTNSRSRTWRFGRLWPIV